MHIQITKYVKRIQNTTAILIQMTPVKEYTAGTLKLPVVLQPSQPFEISTMEDNQPITINYILYFEINHVYSSILAIGMVLF